MWLWNYSIGFTAMNITILVGRVTRQGFPTHMWELVGEGVCSTSALHEAHTGWYHVSRLAMNRQLGFPLFGSLRWQIKSSIAVACPEFQTHMILTGLDTVKALTAQTKSCCIREGRHRDSLLPFLLHIIRNRHLDLLPNSNSSLRSQDCGTLRQPQPHENPKPAFHWMMSLTESLMCFFTLLSITGPCEDGVCWACICVNTFVTLVHTIALAREPRSEHEHSTARVGVHKSVKVHMSSMNPNPQFEDRGD